MATDRLTIEYLKQRLHYDPFTGYFTWLETLTNSIKPGERAGYLQFNKHNGKQVICIRLGHKSYLAHRLAWFYMTGNFPLEQIDHINGDSTENKWLNLRQVTDSENKKNLRLYSSNKSGIPGVWWYARKNRWRAYIKVNGLMIILLHTQDFFEAVCSRKCAELKYGFHINHGSIRPL